MYVLIRLNKDITQDYFGPFPSESRAMEYAEAFEGNVVYRVEPLIVPNCVTVKLEY